MHVVIVEDGKGLKAFGPFKSEDEAADWFCDSPPYGRPVHHYLKVKQPKGK